MKQLSICRICEQFPPAKGGLAPGMLQLSLAQHQQGHYVTVITPTADGDRHFDSGLPFPVVRIGSTRTFQFSWKAFNAYRGLNDKPNIVHTHGPAAFYYLARKTKKDTSLVHTVHAVRRFQYDLYKRYLSENKNKELLSAINYSNWHPYIAKELFLERSIIMRADHLCLVADYFKDKLAEYYGVNTQKITTVLNGSSYRTNKIDKKANREFKKSSVVLFVGRFDWHKRIQTLIEAHSLVIRKKPSCQLILVGDGDQRPSMEILIKKLDLQNNVCLSGWVDSDRLNYFYNMADCICLPSISEGLPKVLLEAMSFGIPIIASDNLAHKELLKNGKFGYLVNGSDPEKWANTILQVLTNGSTINVNTNETLNLFENLYRWSHVATRIQNAYDKVLNM
jgi:glycosyltransferase involved in cell wall biosynthesis